MEKQEGLVDEILMVFVSFEVFMVTQAGLNSKSFRESNAFIKETCQNSGKNGWRGFHGFNKLSAPTEPQPQFRQSPAQKREAVKEVQPSRLAKKCATKTAGLF